MVGVRLGCLGIGFGVCLGGVGLCRNFGVGWFGGFGVLCILVVALVGDLLQSCQVGVGGFCVGWISGWIWWLWLLCLGSLG